MQTMYKTEKSAWSESDPECGVDDEWVIDVDKCQAGMSLFIRHVV